VSLETGPEARALWIVGPGKAEIRPSAAPAPTPGWVRAQALVSGISRGTESLVFHGKIPGSEHERMRCPFQEGAFTFPVKYGYAMVGWVTDGGMPPGQRIFCLHPHQDRFTVPMEAALPVPGIVTTERTVLAPQMETALNATWDAGLEPGQRVAVVGGGVIGILTAYLCARTEGISATLIDADPGRASIAKTLGIPFALPGQMKDGSCDVVFHASGRAEGLATALGFAAFEGTIVELSWYGADLVPVPLGGAFHSQRLTLRASQVGSVAQPKRGQVSMRQRLEQALALCADPRLDVLVAEETKFDDIPARLSDILGKPGALCHLIRYS